jgi:L-alanine-DL-glutamate epimerase-like enolase superfamily enzyme
VARWTARTRRLRLRAPLRTAWGELAEREIIRVRIDFGPGDFGVGEAAPLEPYDGVPLGAVRAALDVHATVLGEAGPQDARQDLLAACAAAHPLPQALAAVDLALWDREARRAGRSLARLLEPGAPASVAVNATVGAEDRAGAAAQAAAAAAAGFRCVKVKVGVGDDAGRLAAVRAAVGGGVAVRADANGAWGSPEEALANLRALAPVGLELCEEPVHGVEALRAVRAASPVPVAMDETAAEPGAPGAGAADAVVVKVSRGGVTGALRDARAAREAGARVYVASTYDGPLGIAAGVQVAAALAATGPVLACGLATLAAFEGTQREELLPRGGVIPLPSGPGILRIRP